MGKLYAKHDAKGFNMDVMDSLIAATTLVHHLTVVTRNTADFPADVKTINPWGKSNLHVTSPRTSTSLTWARGPATPFYQKSRLFGYP